MIGIEIKFTLSRIGDIFCPKQEKVQYSCKHIAKAYICSNCKFLLSMQTFTFEDLLFNLSANGKVII